MARRSINAYHGTTEPKADSILKHGFWVSTKDTEWLGQGVYFFHLKDDAKTWALAEVGKPKNVRYTPATICAKIHVDDIQFIDLDMPEVRRDFNSSLKEYSAFIEAASCGAPVFSSPAQARCYYINVYCKHNPDILLIALSFPKGYDEFSLPQSQRQYCVKDKGIISELRKEALDYAI